MTTNARTTSPERAGILYVSHGTGRAAAVAERLSRVGVTLVTRPSVEDAFRSLPTLPVTLCLVDLAHQSGAAAVGALRSRYPHLPVAALADSDDPRASSDATAAGAIDILSWPFEDVDAMTLFVNARDAAPTVTSERTSLRTDDGLIARSPAMQRVAELVVQAARTKAGVSVSGEPGTGRSFVGTMIHRLADANADRPLVTADCAGDTPQNLERRLFGTTSSGNPSSAAAASERMTSAGALYHARGGTLLLRNVPDAPLRVQARLARVLRDREAVLANGHDALIDVDVQVVAILDTPASTAVSEGRIRRDLHKQLAQVEIDMPALRRRREDIPPLAEHLLREICVERGVTAKIFSRSVVQVMSVMPWNGNAPELKSLLERLVVSVDGPVLQLEHLLAHTSFSGLPDLVEPGSTLRDAKERFERECISAVLMRHHGRVPEAAKALGIQRTNLYRRIRQLNVARSLLSARK